MNLITDRTQAHVDRLRKLQMKGWANLTDAEKAEWYGVASKGAYNYTDLNRVEQAVSEIAESLGLALSTKTDWNQWSVPTQEDMSRYLENIEKLKAACPNSEYIQALPIRMAGLTFEAANRIEEVLLATRRSADSIPRSGEILCGEV